MGATALDARPRSFADERPAGEWPWPWGCRAEPLTPLNFAAEALYDFQPEAAGEMALHAGDMLFVIAKGPPGWLKAHKGFGKDVEQGLVPETYVQVKKKLVRPTVRQLSNAVATLQYELQQFQQDTPLVDGTAIDISRWLHGMARWLAPDDQQPQPTQLLSTQPPALEFDPTTESSFGPD